MGAAPSLLRSSKLSTLCCSVISEEPCAGRGAGAGAELEQECLAGAQGDCVSAAGIQSPRRVQPHRTNRAAGHDSAARLLQWSTCSPAFDLSSHLLAARDGQVVQNAAEGVASQAQQVGAAEGAQHGTGGGLQVLEGLQTGHERWMGQ